MKHAALKYRFLIATLIVLIIYIAITHDGLTRRFGAVGPVPYLSGLTTVVLMSSLFIRSRSLQLRLGWAAIAPEIGSVVGYALVILTIELENRVGASLQQISVWDLMLAAAIMPFFQARIWAISMGLLTVCVADFYFIRRQVQTGQNQR